MENTMFMIDGTKEDIILALYNNGIDKIEDAEKLLDYLLENQEFLGDDEEIDSGETTMDVNFMGLVMCDNSYYVNIKTTTIVIIATLLDIYLTKGFASVALSLFGVYPTAFTRIEEKNGEKCILKETLAATHKKGNLQILDQNKGKCCYPLSCCKYRNEEECSCTSDDIILIYEKLCEKNVLEKKLKEHVYFYKW